MSVRLENRVGRMWSVRWVILVRAILYLVVTGFFLQYMYFGDDGRIYKPDYAIALMVGVFAVNLLILAFGSGSRYIDQLIVLTYVLDLVVLTWIILVSGGFNSMFIPYYLPVLVMAVAWLPRRFTAVFPSIATLGAAYIGLAHLFVSLGERAIAPALYPDRVLALIRYSPSHSVVANMLILAVLFFVISYLSGFLIDKLFLEQRLNAEVLSSMNEGVAVVTRIGQLAYANSEFIRLFPEIEHTSDFRLIASVMFAHEEGDLSLDSLLRQSAADTLILHRENEGRQGRPPMEIRVSGISLRGKADLFGLVFMVTDLTLRRRMEEAERNVERFSSISTMAAGLAHEIRNPLASLRSAVQEIGDSFPHDSQNRMLTNLVIAESDRLDGVIGRFLDFSREGELRLTKKRLGALLEAVRTMLLKDKRAEDLTIALSIRDDPEIVCDADRVKEVFINLALNASQAAPRVGGKVDIVLDSAKKGVVPGVEILFMDNGPGMSDNAFLHLFEPFFSSKEGGTGMGLPISRKQVVMHGGDIVATNLPQGGACFQVWLPLVAAANARVSIRGSRRQTRVYVQQR